MSTESEKRARASPAPSANLEETSSNPSRRTSHFKEYKFFRSFSAKVENWPMRKAEALWRRMRERKIAGTINLNIMKFINIIQHFIHIIIILLIFH